MKALLPLFLLAAVAVEAADVSGKWSGTANVKSSDGQMRALTVFFIFKQEGIRLTGSGGQHEGDQVEIQNGRVEGDRVTFEIAGRGAPVRLDLKAVEDRVEGEAKRPGEVATIVLKRFTGKCQSAPQPAETVPVLTPGRAIEREIAGGATHSYQVNLRPAEFLSAVVDQLGVSVDVAAYGPDGKQIRSFAGPVRGGKNVDLVAEGAGAYRLEVKGAEKAAPGCYEIRVDKIQSYAERIQPPLPQEQHRSPRIAALRREIQSDNRAALAAFWQEIATKGAPLVEPLDEDPRQALVTFLWRATTETHNVLILWDRFTTRRMDDFKMLRLLHTDLWYRSVRIRRDARVFYRLSPNDPLFEGPLANAQRSATAQVDPLNPRRWPENPRPGRFQGSSLVELPGAPPQPWVARRPEVPAGTVEKHRLKSEILKNERQISVYTPPGYRREGPPYGLLVLFDESAYLSLVPTPVILDNLIAEKRIPPLVAVLIANPSGETRNRELPCNPDFAEFLHRELAPWTRRLYQVTSDPAKIIVGGSSYGGLAAACAALRHPETFGNVLCQSGSFWWTPVRNPLDPNRRDELAEPNWVAQQFLTAPKLPVRFYLDAGSFEVDVLGSGGVILETSRHLRDVLRAKGYEVHYQEFAGGHDYLQWRGTLADGLLALVGVRD